MRLEFLILQLYFGGEVEVETIDGKILYDVKPGSVSGRESAKGKVCQM